MFLLFFTLSGTTTDVCFLVDGGRVFFRVRLCVFVRVRLVLICRILVRATSQGFIIVIMIFILTFAGLLLQA